MDPSCEASSPWDAAHMLGVGVASAWTFVFCALDYMFVSEPDMKGGESPELVSSWGEGMPWGQLSE